MTYGPLIDLPLVSQFAHPATGLIVTRNAGNLQDYVQCGDGVTPATLPVMIGGGVRGIVSPAAASTALLQHLTLPALGTNGSVYGLVKFSPLTLTESTTHVMAMGCLTSADYGTAWLLAQYDTRLILYWGGGASIITTAVGSIGAGVHSVAATCDGALCHLYLDAQEIGIPAAPSAAAVKTGLNIFGTANAAFPQPRTTCLYDFKLYPYALTPTQIRAIGERDRATMNLF
jgi:hypothetical protein